MGDIPTRCDFCHRQAPPEELLLWPCLDFAMIGAVREATTYTVCACHGLDALPPDATIFDRRTFVGPWAACPACRADVDRDDWEAVASRHVARHRRSARRDDPPGARRTIMTGTYQLVGAHLLPPPEGRWLSAAAYAAIANRAQGKE